MNNNRRSAGPHHNTLHYVLSFLKTSQLTTSQLKTSRLSKGSGGVWRAGAALAVFATAVFSASVSEVSASSTGRGAAARNVMLSSYNDEFMRALPASTWNGDVDRCQAGATSEAFKLSVLQRVNWYRSVAGLAPVGYDATHDQEAQLAALIQSASGYLTHGPTASQPCWTSDGAAGSARSNLALGTYGVGAIDGYMEDPGASNTAAGHRWWILSPKLGAVAFGDIPGSATHHESNAMWVTNTSTAVAARDGFIAWPAAGAFPDALAPTRWSFDINLPGDSYSNAVVTVTGPQGAVPVSVVNRSTWLVWEMPGSLDVSADATYSVSISGVSATGVASTGATYNVTLVDANRAPSMTATIGYGMNTCSSMETVVGGGMFLDDRGSDLIATLIPGDGAADNEKFTVSTDKEGAVTLAVAESLPLSQTEYSVRVSVADADGGFVESVIRFDVIDAAKSDRPCPARNIAVVERGDRTGWAVVAWEAPVMGPVVTYMVTRAGVVVCSSATTSCQANLGAGAHTLKVIAVSEQGLTAYSQRVLVTLNVVQPPTKTGYLGGTRVKVTTLMSLPAGTRTWSVTGPCVLSSEKVWVRFYKRAGVCRLKVTGRKRVGAKTVIRVVTASALVRWPA